MDLWLLFAITEPTVLMLVSLIWRYLLPNHISESSAKASGALIESVHTVGSLGLEARDKLRIETDVQLHLLDLQKLTTLYCVFSLSS